MVVRKNIGIITLFLLVNSSMSAQFDSTPLKAKYGKVRFHSEGRKANWFLSFGGGEQTFFSPHFPANGQIIYPGATLSVGKMLSPEWGIRLNTNGGQANSKTHVVRYGTANLDMLLNLSTIIGGYYEWRPFEFSLFYGPGYLQTLKYQGQAATSKTTLHAGAILSFRMSRFTNLNFEFQQNTTGFPGENGVLSMATVGFNIKIGKRRYTAYVPEELLSEQSYRETLQLEAEIKRLKERVEKAENKPKTIMVHDTIYINNPVKKKTFNPVNP
ncbi:MAG: hypothetical protein Q8909_08090 [Bacteroidota bacterium]|nr:hypothetical protein [Bacteroidota bacterium]